MNEPKRAQINKTIIELVEEDITKQAVDAIVNAANTSLLGGGGVDGAIHRAAGPNLVEECRRLNGCKTGEAKITGGYRLPAKHVIHAVGPVYNQGGATIADLLASAYRNSLRLAIQHDLHTVACPAISTGVYGYPLAEAAEIALNAVCDFALEHDSLALVRFCLIPERVYWAFASTLRDLPRQDLVR